MEHSASHASHPRPRPRRTPSPTKTSKSPPSPSSSASKVTISKASSPRRPISRGALSSSSSTSGHALQALDANAKGWRSGSRSPRRKGQEVVDKVYTRSAQVAIPTLSPRKSGSDHVKVYVDRTDKPGQLGSIFDVSDDDEKENVPPEGAGIDEQFSSRSPALNIKKTERLVFADIPMTDPRRRFELHDRGPSTLNSDMLSEIIDSEILDDEDEVPVYATPARPRIRKFHVGDYLGPMLTSRNEKGWPLSAPTKANGNFDFATLDEVFGDTRRKIRFDIFVDSDANKENVDPMEITVGSVAELGMGKCLLMTG
ncbi:hypothetical protein V1520DRAFT_100904 [Lipomyces starkeyi]|uniref:Uncharacterized protein n=1 Tax=Lipomyces starkeyi NRRL Y-11557 TaxID=675824 RepID=A0A1E3QBP3_LIPST|nr:hypothetical protein LIPSTDRAFT_69275 [Lipomyces starkeyi NRRL Y-11557]